MKRRMDKRTDWRMVFLLIAVLSAYPTIRLSAQCPDGSPPPCRAQPTRVGPPSNSVAVLYFDNLARDSADAYLADGLTEEIIVRLGHVRRLEVASRSAARWLRGRGQAPAVLGRLLGVAYIVSGSVRPAGRRLRVTAELVRARTGTRVWGDVFDLTSADLLAVQAEIAQAVATAIAGQLLPGERAHLAARPTRDPIAYDLYLRGQFFFGRFTQADIHRAIDLYGQALARDSTFAAAYAATAVAWNALADDWLSPRDAYPNARVAAERALAIDTSATALAGLFWPVLALDRDMRRAETLMRRALELDPRLAPAQLLSFVIWSVRGNSAEAVAAARRVWEVDTLSYSGAFFYSEALAQSRRFEELSAFVPRARDLMTPSEARGWEGVARFGSGDCPGAVALLREASETHFRMDLGLALVCAGQGEGAQALLDSTLAESSRRYVNAYFIAALYVALDQVDKAFSWLDRAVEERTGYLAFLPTDFRWDSIRSDSRFAALLRRIGLVEDSRPPGPLQ
jgi:TolB-like protein